MPPSTFWIKLYHEILHDPKMGMLPDNLWRRAIELFLLAGENGKKGVLPDIDEIAWILRQPKDVLEREFSQLAGLEILSKTEGGEWFVTNFAKRQKKIDAAERMRAMRQRQRDGKEPIREKAEVPEPTPTPPENLNGREPDISQKQVDVVTEDNTMSIRNATKNVTTRNIELDIESDITTNVVSDKPLPPTSSKKAKPEKKPETIPKVSLEPETPGEIALFEKINEERRANGYNRQRKFKTVAQKKKFHILEENATLTDIEFRINKAFERGIFALPQLLNYITGKTWSEKKGQTNGSPATNQSQRSTNSPAQGRTSGAGPSTSGRNQNDRRGTPTGHRYAFEDTYNEVNPPINWDH